MSHLQCSVRQFRERLLALEPGDTLAPLSGFVLPDHRILVLDRDDDGTLTLSVASHLLHLVVDPLGPYRWSQESETLVDQHGNPHELIDLDTQVSKGEGAALVGKYREIAMFAESMNIVSRAHFSEVMAEEPETALAIEALLRNEWLPTMGARVAACMALILRRPLSGREQAHLITVVNGIMQSSYISVRVVESLPEISDAHPGRLS